MRAARIAHHIPGRLRIVIATARRDIAFLARAAAEVGELAGVQWVTVSPHSGSLIVHYREDQSDIVDALRDLGKGLQLFNLVSELPSEPDGTQRERQLLAGEYRQPEKVDTMAKAKRPPGPVTPTEGGPDTREAGAPQEDVGEQVTKEMEAGAAQQDVNEQATKEMEAADAPGVQERLPPAPRAVDDLQKVASEIAPQLGTAAIAAIATAIVEAELLPAVLIGAGAALMPKLLLGAGYMFRPVLKTMIRAGYAVFTTTQQFAAEATKQVRDVITEVKAEQRPPSASAPSQ